MRPLDRVRLLLAFALTAGCSDSSGPRLTSIDQLTGSWTLDTYVAIDTSDASKMRNMFTVVGFNWDTLVIAQGGAAILTYGNAGDAFADTTLLTLNNGTLTWITLQGGNPAPGTPLLYRFMGTGTHMSWLSESTYSIDVDGDGVADPVYLRMAWHRL